MLCKFLKSVFGRTKKLAVKEKRFPAMLYEGGSVDENKILFLVDKARSKKSSPLLMKEYTLCKTARLRLEEIKQNFRHKPESLKHKHDLKDIGLVLYGENIIKGVPPKDMVSAWMKSDGHRKELLRPEYIYTGIAIGKVDRIWYGVQVFGR